MLPPGSQSENLQRFRSLKDIELEQLRNCFRHQECSVQEGVLIAKRIDHTLHCIPAITVVPRDTQEFLLIRQIIHQADQESLFSSAMTEGFSCSAARMAFSKAYSEVRENSP